MNSKIKILSFYTANNHYVLRMLIKAQLGYLRKALWNHKNKQQCLIFKVHSLFSPCSFNLMCLYVNLPSGSGTHAVMCGLVGFELQD